MTTRPPTLFLTVGLPGTGKTTEARRLEVEEKALRLTKDEWVKALYGFANPPSASDVIEGRLIEIGLRALELGIDVVIDFGLWGRDERSALRQAAADVGAAVEMRYFELPLAEQRRRLDRRQAEETSHDMAHVRRGARRVGCHHQHPDARGTRRQRTCRLPAGRIRDLGGVAQASLAPVGPLILKIPGSSLRGVSVEVRAGPHTAV
jgi:predicted kinase